VRASAKQEAAAQGRAQRKEKSDGEGEGQLGGHWGLGGMRAVGGRHGRGPRLTDVGSSPVYGINTVYGTSDTSTPA
jgi:hypothetical protein